MPCVPAAPERPGAHAEVRINVYNCDRFTGFLNRAFLSGAELGIFHVGVQVFGEEWSFQYFLDAWDDPVIPGVVRCMPTRMPEYEYLKSISLGRTMLAQHKVDEILLNLHREWPASSYHLVHKNCISFAQRLVDLLEPPEPFPPWLCGVVQAAQRSVPLEAAVGLSWDAIKWWTQQRTVPISKGAGVGAAGKVMTRSDSEAAIRCGGAANCPALPTCLGHWTRGPEQLILAAATTIPSTDAVFPDTSRRRANEAEAGAVSAYKVGGGPLGRPACCLHEPLP